MTDPEAHEKTMLILCKCGEEVQVSRSCCIEWQICRQCGRMGNWEILPLEVTKN